MLSKTGAVCLPEEYKQIQPLDKGQYAPGKSKPYLIALIFN